MAYTNAEKTTMYQSIQSDLTNVVAKLQEFLEQEGPAKPGTEPTDEQNFARATSQQLTATIGSCAVRVKRCQDSE